MVSRPPDEARYRATLAELKARFPDEARGFYGPGSMTWKIYREPAILIGSYRALLLQVAHPAVAVGVAQNSSFQKDYLGRAYRTFFNMASIFFGSRSEAFRVAGHLYRMHQRIRGEYRDAKGQQRAFVATEPALLRWILATLVETSITAYELVHGPLPDREKAQFFQESRITALLMGIPAEDYPTSYEDFCRYYQQTLSDGSLRVDERGLALAAAILRGPFRWGAPLIRLFATGLLPEPLRQAYQLPWTAPQEDRLARYLRLIRRWYRFCPRALRTAPPYYQAQYRIGRVTGKRTGWLAYFFPQMGRWFKAPFLIRA